MPRSSVNDANKHLRPTVREGDDGRSAVSFNGAGHPGATMCETVLRLDPSDAEIPAAAGLSAGTMLPVKITARKFELIGKFPVATQEEYDALTDAQKDQATILGLDEAPIGSEAKCYEHDGAGNVIDCLTWIRRGSGWTNGLGTLSPSGDVAVAGAITASAVRAPKNLPGIGALSPLGNGGSSVGIAATYISQYPALAPYMMVRPRFKNFTASPWTINSFKFASAPTDENDGTTLTWVAGTIAGAAGGDVPAAIGSSASVQPGILYGNAVPLASLARTDVVGALPLLQMRVYSAAGSPQQANSGTAALNASTGLAFKGTNASGDRVTTIDARIPVDGTLTYYTCDIEFFYTDRVVSLLDVGDSRSHGAWSDSGEYGPSTGAMVFSLDGNGALVSGANYGIDGAPTAAIHAQLLKMLPIVKPAYATVWMESPNDGNAIGPYNTAFARAVDVVQACIDAGTIPIIYTPTPRNRVTTDLVAWQTAVARIRAYANAGGLLLVDNALEAEDPAVPGAWKAQYKPAGDTSNQHGNQAFYEWQGRELLKRIRGL